MGQLRLACGLYNVVVRQSIIGKKMMSSGFLACTLYSRLWTCGNAQLRGEARVDGAALRALLVQFLAGEVGVDDVLRLNAERCEIAGENGRLRVHVQYARHADADLGAFLLDQGSALLLRGRDLEFRCGSATSGTSGTRNTPLAATSTKFGLAFLTLSRSPLMPRISSIFSTVPFSQVAMISRCAPASSGTLVFLAEWPRY